MERKLEIAGQNLLFCPRTTHKASSWRENMREKLKKILPFAIVLCLLGGIESYAATTYRTYEGEIKGWHANTRFDYKHRSATTTSNPWEVGLMYSGEGEDTITVFWLENFYGDNVSDDVEVYYNNYLLYVTSPYSSANGIDVYLTGENNNFNSDTYKVRGHWTQQQY